MMRPMAPRVHLTNGVLAEVERELEADFELVASPVGADGIVAVLNVVIDDAYLEAAGPQLRIVANYAVGVNNIDLEAARRRGIVISNTPDVLTGATAEVALTLMLSLLRQGDRGRPPHPPPRAVGVLARVHARREPCGQDGADRRRGADRPRDGAARRGVRRDGCPRRPRRRPRRAPAAGRHRLAPLPADGRDAPPDRCPPPRADAADRGPGQHGPRPGRRRGRARRGASRRHDRRRRARRLRARAGGDRGAARLENVVLAPHLGSATRDTRIAMGMLCVSALRAVLLEGARRRMSCPDAPQVAM